MRYAMLCLLMLATAQPVMACDVCGASAGTQNLGLLPQMNRHFAGIQYQYNSYESRHIPLSSNKQVQYSDDDYHTLQLWGRYCIGQRWQLFGFVPYRYNYTTYYGKNAAIKGIGDATIIANYTFINTPDTSDAQFMHRLQAGVGIKAPIGMYKGVTELERQGLPNMQPGTGAWDFPANVNYTLRYRNIGINADASYNITTPNRDNYKYGNRLNSQLTLFYTARFNNISVIPQVGTRYEYALHDYDNYTRKWLNEQTGGYITSAMVGLQFFYKNAGIQLQHYRPMCQNYGGGNIKANYRTDAGIFFLF